MFSVPHLIVIFIVALVVFGPEKIPELARNLGKIMADFRRVTGDLRTTVEGQLRELEREADTRRIAATSVTASAPPAVSTSAASPYDDPQPPGPAPGTVPSKPPYVATIVSPGMTESPEATGPTDVPTYAADPMHDPYMMDVDRPSHDSPAAPEPSDPDAKPERVSDGDRRTS
jgi:TatA/E family protein of Tat protein translocase